MKSLSQIFNLRRWNDSLYLTRGAGWHVSTTPGRGRPSFWLCFLGTRRVYLGTKPRDVDSRIAVLDGWLSPKAKER
jgi:hypothetical protein